jgi:thioredoxin-dependent peroxiredoxin
MTMTVEIGKKVAPFTLEGTGGTFNLSDTQGRWLVLYFYPKDSTPGCTTEGENFRDLQAQFDAVNAVIVGVSRDSLKSHANFKQKLDLNFELLSDPDEQLCTQFDVMKMKNMYGKQVRGVERSTFVIDGKGVLRNEWRGVKVPGHAEEVLNYIRTQ